MTIAAPIIAWLTWKACRAVWRLTDKQQDDGMETE
jgi:hypothetical protein